MILKKGMLVESESKLRQDKLKNIFLVLSDPYIKYIGEPMVVDMIFLNDNLMIDDYAEWSDSPYQIIARGRK
jgi:hypothetical protein